MNLLRRLFFQYWYFRSPPWDTGITPPELKQFVEHLIPGWALDLGCGTGTNSIYLAQQGWHVTGVDFAWRAIQEARRKASQAGVEVDFQVQDVTRLKGLQGPYDLAVDIGCFHNLSMQGRQAYLGRVADLLRPGSRLFLYTFISPPGSSGTGVTESDLSAFDKHFRQVDRQDGFNRQTRSSAYLAYERNH